VLRDFVEYHIAKGNTDVLLKFIWPIMKKKEKVA
jgi:hypothetical protein